MQAAEDDQPARPATKPAEELPKVRIELFLLPGEAWHVAQFLKRAGFNDYLSSSIDKQEAYEMMYACEKVRRQFAEQGFGPR
jgi:hypothetical protein